MGGSSAIGARVLLAGATGYIGRALGQELIDRGYSLVCPVRAQSGKRSQWSVTELAEQWPTAEFRVCDVCDLQSLLSELAVRERFDAVVSCLSTRGGGVADAWKVDHQANLNMLTAAGQVRARQFLLLSAICVQKPRLEFQRAKLAFEEALIESGLDYSIVRPTAFFKSLAGQVERVRSGKPFLLFGNGQLTACKPIAEQDLACFMADCLEKTERRNQILPIGGPGVAITPLQQGRLLFELCGQPEQFRRVPVTLFDVLIPVLSGLGKVNAGLRDKAEFARIGRYYATESMLYLNPETGRYDAAATPSFGSVTLRDFYQRVLLEGLKGQELGEAALFK